MILSDDGVAPLGWFNYAITDQPATVNDLLLRKNDSAFELVLWSEKAEGTNRITVNLGRSHASVKLYHPGPALSQPKSLRVYARFQ